MGLWDFDEDSEDEVQIVQQPAVRQSQDVISPRNRNKRQATATGRQNGAKHQKTQPVVYLTLDSDDAASQPASQADASQPAEVHAQPPAIICVPPPKQQSKDALEHLSEETRAQIAKAHQAAVDRAQAAVVDSDEEDEPVQLAAVTRYTSRRLPRLLNSVTPALDPLLATQPSSASGSAHVSADLESQEAGASGEGEQAGVAKLHVLCKCKLGEIKLNIRTDAKVSALLEAFGKVAASKGWKLAQQVTTYKCEFDGERLKLEQTLASAAMQDDDVVDVLF